MQNIKDFYIRGIPIQVPIGIIHFITMSEYEDIYKYQKLLFYSKEDLHDTIEELLDTTKEDIFRIITPSYIEILQNYQVIEIIKAFKELGYYDVFKFIYDYFCGDGTFDTLILSDKDLLIYKIQIMGKLKVLLNEEDIIKNTNESKEEMDKSIFINIIKNIKQIGLHKAYSELFDFCFKDEKGTFDKIQTDEELKQYIEMIIDMNCVSKSDDEEENDDIDPEIKKFNMYDRLIKESKQGNVTFQSMYASLWLALQKQPEFLTIYQYNTLFQQLGQFKGYEATVAGRSGEPIIWCHDSSKIEKEDNTVDIIDDEIANKALSNMEKVVGDIS